MHDRKAVNGFMPWVPGYWVDPWRGLDGGDGMLSKLKKYARKALDLFIKAKAKGLFDK
jgi:hypothetical protein